MSTTGPPGPPARHPRQVDVGSQSIQRLADMIGLEHMQEAQARAQRLHDRLQGHVVWNINSTASGGGVAELLRVLLPYARGLGIDARWTTIDATPEFFRITKRLHHALHDSEGDRSPLDDHAREVYEGVLQDNADDLTTAVRPGDVVILHDPQTAGLTNPLTRHGAYVIWRCHVGAEEPGTQVDAGWDFLQPYVTRSLVNVFSRAEYVPECCDHGRAAVIPPSIDPFSPKNQEIDEPTVRAILVQSGLVGAAREEVVPTFLREDGSPGRVDRMADITQLGPPPSWETPLVTQVSRWDPLKDPIGVIEGFVQYLHTNDGPGPHLVLAGPNVTSIPDDPEQAATLDRVMKRWRDLPHSIRSRIHLACLPMTDIEENAAIVNALQRHSAIVVQKSLREGFGLTVTEAMWKARPVVASAVGGIQDQIEDGAHGLLLADPTDASAFAASIKRLLHDPELAARLGDQARERVRERYLPLRHLLQYADLIERFGI